MATGSVTQLAELLEMQRARPVTAGLDHAA